MNSRMIIEQEKLGFEVWRRLAGSTKESDWAEVVLWLQERFPHYPESFRRDLLWLLRTQK